MGEAVVRLLRKLEQAQHQLQEAAVDLLNSNSDIAAVISSLQGHLFRLLVELGAQGREDSQQQTEAARSGLDEPARSRHEAAAATTVAAAVLPLCIETLPQTQSSMFEDPEALA